MAARKTRSGGKAGKRSASIVHMGVMADPATGNWYFLVYADEQRMRVLHKSDPTFEDEESAEQAALEWAVQRKAGWAMPRAANTGRHGLTEKIDHAVRGVLGTLGLHAMALSDLAIRAAGSESAAPATTWRQWPVLKAFVHDPDNPNSRFVTEFYDELQKARRASLTYRRLEGAEADAYGQRKAAELERAPQLERAARIMARERKEADRIRESRDYGPEEKRREIADRGARIRAIAKGVMADRP